MLVTGATGFVGRALCAELLRHGHAVCAALRRVEDSTRLALEGVETLAVGTVNAATDWCNAQAGCEAVVHLAARVHVMRDEAIDPLTEFRAVNVEGTLSLAHQAAKAGVRRFIYLSSIKVNGEGTQPPLPGSLPRGERERYCEGDEPAPQDAYAVSKWEAEQGLREIARESGMEGVIIRPPLVYGPGVKANFQSMMHWLKWGVPLPLGAIHNKRSLVALDNLIDLIITCIKHPAAANQTFLVSDGEDLSTTDLLLRVAAALDMPARLLPVPTSMLKAGAVLLGRRDMAQRLCGSLQVDISKARALLGWTPPISVDEGLRRAVSGFLNGLPRLSGSQ